jgi:hypothetical protein
MASRRFTTDHDGNMPAATRLLPNEEGLIRPADKAGT